jgi:diadenosine tetraphosphatase ApaH/serine/threonine PP2A family protein phosphatase
MRYAIFTDIHANLEALEAVLAKIDELAQQEPIDEIWFLGDLVGYGPDPNTCIVKLRERTDVIIAGNHDWAAVGKIDLDDFSAAARISAEWTAAQLTEEHRAFLINLPERLQKGDCTLVHGSPYGPLWEYLTSEALAERSFQYFETRFCLVGHTHVPLIFQQPDSIATLPTIPLDKGEQNASATELFSDVEPPIELTEVQEEDEETTKIGAIHLPALQAAALPTVPPLAQETREADTQADGQAAVQTSAEASEAAGAATTAPGDEEGELAAHAANGHGSLELELEAAAMAEQQRVEGDQPQEVTPESEIIRAEERLNNEIEELLSLLNWSQSLVKVTNEMIEPPEGLWKPPEDFRAIINPGGVGQPRDGDPRAAFMIYDTELGFTFYRVPYEFEKTQEKIIAAGLPPYLATRLAYGR